MQQIKRNRGGQLGNRNAAGHGAPLKNRNAAGHKASTPIGNTNAIKHGFYSRRILTEEERAVFISAMDVTLLEILWNCICLQYAAVVRSQRIMYVSCRGNHTIELISESSSDTRHRTEYDIQFAWDKHATLLEAQSAAMNSLRVMIELYEKLRHKSNDLIELDRQLRIERIKANVERRVVDVDHEEDDFIKAVMEGGNGNVK